MKRAAKYIVGALILVAGLAVALYPQITEWRYAFAQQALASESQVGTTTSAAGGQVLPKGTIARITISKIKLDAFVVEGTGSEQLALGPGHYNGTALPGEKGNSCIAGHRTMHGHVFNRLNELKVGDQIVIVTGTKRVVYRITLIHVVANNDWSIAKPSTGTRLTLSTCHPIGSAHQRLVVVADAVQ